MRTQEFDTLQFASVSGLSGATSTVAQEGVPFRRKRKPRRIGYVRISDDSQNTALQLDAMKAAGCDVLFTDSGVSGRSDKRLGLARALAALREDDTFVVWKIDRIGRIDTELLLMRDQFRKRRITLVSITQGIDTGTAVGRLAYGQLALFAAFELEQLSERTRAGMAAARARGRHVGRLSNRVICEAHRLARKDRPLDEVAAEYGVAAEVLRKGFRRLGLTERCS